MTTSIPQNQLSTADVDPGNVGVVTSSDPSTEAAAAGALAADGAAAMQGQAPISTQEGVGIEGEVDVWEGRYSPWNFAGRILGATLLTIGWIALSYYLASGKQAGRNPAVLSWILGAALGIMWLALLYRMALACWGHSYRLTNRRLFVSTGVFRRRRDQIELLRVQDVYTKQTFGQRILSLGTVSVVSTEPHFPILYLLGVVDPQETMDRVWHYARAERDKRSVKVDAI